MTLVKPPHITRKNGRITEIISKSCQQGNHKFIQALAIKGNNTLLANHYKCINFVYEYYKAHNSMPTKDVFMDNPEYVDFWVDDVSDTALSYDFLNYWQENVLRILSNKTNELKNELNTGIPVSFSDLNKTIRELSDIDTEDARPIDVFHTDWDYMFDPTKRDGLYLGIPLLDNNIYGLRRGEVCTIVGDTNVGKSWFMAFMAACQLLKGKFVVFVTGEMTKEDTVSRILSFITKTNPKILRELGDDKKILEAKLEFAVAMRDLRDKGSRLIILDKKAYSADMLRSEVIKLEEQFDATVDIIFIDGIYLMSTNEGKKGDDWTVQAAIANEYTMESRESQWRLVISTQLERGKTGDTSVNSSNIGKSYAYAQTATVSMAVIESDSYMPPIASSVGVPIIPRTCKIIKNRVGANNVFSSIGMDYTNMIWREYDLNPSGGDMIEMFKAK